MAIYEIIEEIRKLAKRRNWDMLTERFCLHEDANYLVIARFGLRKYRKLFDNRHSYNSIVTLDKQLLEIIRKYIPEARKIPFKFYSSERAEDVYIKKVKNTLLQYPPEIS